MRPTVFLNHFFLTLDAATFRAVRDNAFLRERFAPFEQRTTHRNDTSYTGIYYYGRNTYFEFFQEGESEGKPAGASGVAFGVEASGGAQTLSSAFPLQRLITRKTGTEELLWFHSGEREGANRDAFFRTWVMEYHTDFLRSWYPELPPQNANALRRRNVLDRYVAKLEQFGRRNEFLMKDVTAIGLELAAADQAAFLKLVQELGYQVSGSVATGPEVRLTVNAVAKPVGIRTVGFSLQQSIASEQRHRMGRSELLLSPRGHALWTFTAF